MYTVQYTGLFLSFLLFCFLEFSDTHSATLVFISLGLDELIGG